MTFKPLRATSCDRWRQQGRASANVFGASRTSSSKARLKYRWSGPLSEAYRNNRRNRPPFSAPAGSG
eukprot:36538-Alexandrium_andersonii.AAC.1